MLTEDMTDFFDDFAETANIYRARDKNILGASVIIDRNVDVVSDNGLAVTKRTLVAFRKDQLLSGQDQVRLDEGDEIVVVANGAETRECYQLAHVLTEDASIVQWYVR